MKALCFAWLTVALLSMAGTAQAQEDDTTTDVAPVVEISTALTLERARLTYYVESGLTYDGGHTYPGSCACSWDIPMHSTIVFRDGETFTCTDRGRLGWSGWIDLFRRPDLAAKYGAYTTVQVVVP